MSNLVLVVTPQEYHDMRKAFDDNIRICVCKDVHDCVDDEKLAAALQEAIGFAPLGTWHVKIDWTQKRPGA